MPQSDLKNIVFMKFGYHAKEGEQDIISRKMQEYAMTGKIFWGYGGTLCHPTNQIKPFVDNAQKLNEDVWLAMSFTPSRPNMAGVQAIEYSADGKKWLPIPDGIMVTGSKYAIVCENLISVDTIINLADYEIAVGKSTGKLGNEYIQYQVDKGCLKKHEHTNDDLRKEIEIKLCARLVAPYAVFVR